MEEGAGPQRLRACEPRDDVGLEVRREGGEERVGGGGRKREARRCLQLMTCCGCRPRRSASCCRAASASRSVTPSAPGSSKPATTAALAVPSTGTAAGGMGGDDISEWRCSPVTSRTARDVVGIGSGSGADAIVAASLARSGVPLHLVDGVHCAVSCTSWCSSNGFFCCWC